MRCGTAELLTHRPLPLAPPPVPGGGGLSPSLPHGCPSERDPLEFAVAVLSRTAGGGACEGSHLAALSEYECRGGHFVEAVGPTGGVWGGEVCGCRCGCGCVGGC